MKLSISLCLLFISFNTVLAQTDLSYTLNTARKFYDKKDYKNAKLWYKRALLFKENCNECKNRIIVCQEALSSDKFLKKSNIYFIEKFSKTKNTKSAKLKDSNISNSIINEDTSSIDIDTANIKILAKGTSISQRDSLIILFKNHISAADSLFSKEDYAASLVFYSNALQVSDSCQRCIDQIIAISTKLTTSQNKNTLNDNFQTLLATANKFYDDDEYVNAIETYKAANNINQNCKICSEMIEIARSKENNKRKKEYLASRKSYRPEIRSSIYGTVFMGAITYSFIRLPKWVLNEGSNEYVARGVKGLSSAVAVFGGILTIAVFATIFNENKPKKPQYVLIRPNSSGISVVYNF